ncbi:hypothetical protein C6988_06280 [Nitrosopumilus sp. b1]|nr:hypothetical protein C6988_06280 [Nitrosopumilus sp. b1]
MDNLSVLRGPYIQKSIQKFMKSKRINSKEKTMVISVGQITKASMGLVSKVLKTADNVKRSKITIKLEKE